MDKELEMKLVKKYPTVMRDYGGSIYETCMGWGICVGNGWYDIIDELCAKLEPLGVVAGQIKEKFGGLRFYVEAMTINGDGADKVRKAINEAEIKSYQTCESCGKPGERRGGGWIQVLCDECFNKE